nr:MAG TPA: hypothetical protein [Caudoviricetes sp.]
MIKFQNDIAFLIPSSNGELSSKLHRTYPIVTIVPVRRPQRA